VKDLLSIDREANAIRLRRSTFSGAFLFVEGDSDKTFYSRFIDAAKCSVVVISGKPSSKLRVIEVLKLLEADTFHGILAIVDADCDRLSTSFHQSPNLLRTDAHDLETMLFNSFALNKVITELGSEEKLAKFGREVSIALLEAATPIGYLRWISQCDGLNLCFEGISFSKFVDVQTLQIDQLNLIEEVRNKSQAFSIKIEDLQKRLIDQQSCYHDPWQICCGHDLTEILSLGLRKAIASIKAIEVDPSQLERNLRLAYEESYFRETHLYGEICRWEARNEPFQVLRLKYISSS
jgi:Protein of unknown function (DUF4435)